MTKKTSLEMLQKLYNENTVEFDEDRIEIERIIKKATE